eukprot:TRINITY_DN3131_c0_g1_i1.p1 TRINITY_DN3131_c0_g1~~TRINITY_DN3131_c0_g1_i1.p1  ORF type:complete len:367 (-),score=61.35 TRINITY_DN3131_c0_g1_i1:148-1248(-)
MVEMYTFVCSELGMLNTKELLKTISDHLERISKCSFSDDMIGLRRLENFLQGELNIWKGILNSMKNLQAPDPILASLSLVEMKRSFTTWLHDFIKGMDGMENVKLCRWFRCYHIHLSAKLNFYFREFFYPVSSSQPPISTNKTVYNYIETEIIARLIKPPPSASAQISARPSLTLNSSVLSTSQLFTQERRLTLVFFEREDALQSLKKTVLGPPNMFTVTEEAKVAKFFQKKYNDHIIYYCNQPLETKETQDDFDCVVKTLIANKDWIDSYLNKCVEIKEKKETFTYFLSRVENFAYLGWIARNFPRVELEQLKKDTLDACEILRNLDIFEIEEFIQPKKKQNGEQWQLVTRRSSTPFLFFLLIND